MRLKILVLLTTLLLSATLAVASAKAPKFSTPMIVGAGELTKTKKQSLAFDKTSIYATYENGGMKVVSSDNNGKKWNQSITFPGSDSLSQRIAVSKDPLNSAKSIIHAIWKAGDAVLYSYNGNSASQAGWSKPISALDLSKIPGQSSGEGINFAVASSGAVHVVYGHYYVTASAPGALFSAPEQIQPDLEYAKSTLSTDSAKNLYAVHMSFDSRAFYLSKKVADAASWPKPVKVYKTSADLSGDYDFVALDANNSYLAAYEGAVEGNKGDLIILISTNGGATWIKRTVVANTPHGDAGNNPTVVVSSNKVITYASEVYDAEGLNPVVKVWRSNDNGATWSTATTIKGSSTPYLTLDASGKVNLLVRDNIGNLMLTKEQ
jgi:hypothetical protein